MLRSPVRRFAPLFYWRVTRMDAPDAMTAGWLHRSLEVEGFEDVLNRIPPMLEGSIRAWRKLNQARRWDIVCRFMEGPQQARMVEPALWLHGLSNQLLTVAARLEQTLEEVVAHDLGANPVLVKLKDAALAVRETRRAAHNLAEYPDVRDVAAAWRRCAATGRPHLWNKATTGTKLYAKPSKREMMRLRTEVCPWHRGDKQTG